jgi:ADP-heptose:LPS heptosyltransferase
MAELIYNSTERGWTESEHEAAPDPFVPGLLSRLAHQPETVAIVCASRIGDFICATPAFRALKKRLPAARITLLGLPFVREMAERSPYLDGFEPFPGFPGIADQFFDARRATAFFDRMQARRFDLAVQMHGSGLYSNIFALMLGARYTAGFVRDGYASRLDAAMPWPASLHAGRRALALALFLGAESSGGEPEFGLIDEDRKKAGRLLEACSEPLIGLHAWSREAAKMWPEEKFAAAGLSLSRLLGGTVIVLGGPQEGAAGERIARMIGPSARSLAGRESLGEMGAVIARLSVLITNDSGPAHIAYALAVPTVTLFGETDPTEWGPPPRPFHRVLRPLDRRLSSIQVEEVVSEGAAAAQNRNLRPG